MSVVTDTILLTGCDFDPALTKPDELVFQSVNTWTQTHCGQEFRRLDDNKAAYGGNKVLQASVWVGAFNHFDIDAFVDFLRTCEFHTWVHLAYQREEDNGFHLVQVNDVPGGRAS